MSKGHSSRPKIMVVDDDAALAEMLQIVLQQEGFETAWCTTGNGAASFFAKVSPDLVLLDVMLPGVDGVWVCRHIRQRSGVPIIMLTAKSETEDIVRGLDAGADDYVVKPFKTTELVARIRARLRGVAVQPDDGVLRVGDLTISTVSHSVTRGDETINVTPLEFDLLVAMARKPGTVMSREELLEEVWGYRHSTDNRLVNVHIQRLRAKVERDPEHPEIIVTVRGVGYRAGIHAA